MAALLAACPALAFAHAAEAGRPALAWTFEPWVIALLALSGGAYAVGVARLWSHAGAGRGLGARAAAAFACGWIVLVIALVSPVDALGGHLFAAHMVQHELLMVVAAPLLVMGRPLAAWSWALPAGWRAPTGRFFHRPAWRAPWLVLTGALAAWLLHALALWLWHVPAWFDAALAHPGMHTLQHLAFVVTALLFWWSVLGVVTRQDRAIALASLFTTMLHTGALGALLALAPLPWYSAYAETTLAFGMTPLEDQQLGGLVMWVPAGVVYVGCALVLAAQLLGRRPLARRAGTA
ncbi:cytochrome c oxidase assembly protein [Piscinibacter koreensis]|uniref:cytochrome c oxidase assembly protein n=1 Tax=Piscinibacter koreensis TaxID=2742824 RepID=UPI003158DBB7